MSKKFITGSRAYGTQRPDSDIDIVVRIGRECDLIARRPVTRDDDKGNCKEKRKRRKRKERAKCR